MFYFARVDAEDSTFDPSFARNDFERFAESDGRRVGSVLSFELTQEEGDFAFLQLVVANPREGLLSGPHYLWFSRDNGTDVEPMGFFRLVGIPDDIFGNRVTVQFTARPIDLNAQKSALAASMRVLPYYDPIFLDETRRTEADAVLEGYGGIWSYDRITHEVGYSDYLTGEDGVEEFFAADLLTRGLQLSFDQIPLTSVHVKATIPWVQRATGGVSLTEYVTSNWPNESGANSYITSFSLTENDWPKQGGSLNGGWTVVDGTCLPVYDLTVLSKSGGVKQVINWNNWGGGTTTSELTTDDQYLKAIPPGSVDLPNIVTEDSVNITRDKPDVAAGESNGEITSFSRSLSYSDGIVPLHYLRPTLVIGFDAKRPRKELISFTLQADVQPIVTEPGDDETLQLELDAADVSEPIDVADDTAMSLVAPIDDPRRRSYIVTPRGELSLQHLICVARANLIKRARCAKVTFEPKDHLRMADITLRKNAIIHDPRLPGGVALGKITSYRYALDGGTGRPECSIDMGCAVGRGGEIEEIDGDPIYVEDDYIGPDEDWQEYIGRRIVFDTGVGYSPALFDPNDDGIDFLSALTPADVIEQALAVESPPATQRTLLEDFLSSGWAGPFPVLPSTEHQQQLLRDREEAIRAVLEANPTRATFKLKSMEAVFSSEQDITVTELKIPAMIDFEVSA